jgi:hypothetical protein
MGSIDMDEVTSVTYDGQTVNQIYLAESSGNTLIWPRQVEYTTSYANVHSTNPKNVSGYGCLWNSDLGWSVYLLEGQLYIAIGMLSSTNHGSANQNTLRLASPESLANHYTTTGWSVNNKSIFVETVRLPLTTVGTWVYGTGGGGGYPDYVIWPTNTSYVGGSRFSNWFGHGVHHYAPGYDTENNYSRWMMRAKLETNNRITVEMNPGRYGTGDTGSSMTLNALNCCFNIIAGRANGTPLEPFTFSYV